MIYEGDGIFTQFMVGEVFNNRKPQLAKQFELDRSLVRKVGGGIRPIQIVKSENILLEYAKTHPRIFNKVAEEWYSYNKALMSFMKTAKVWWPCNKDELFSNEAFAQIAIRFQPSIYHLKCFLSIVEQENLQLDIYSTHLNGTNKIIDAIELLPDYETLLNRITTNIDEIVIEFFNIGSFFDEDESLTALISNKDYGKAAIYIKENKANNYYGIVLQAYLFFLAADFDMALEMADKLEKTSDCRHLANALVIKMALCIYEGRFEEALDLFDTKNTTVLNKYKEWNEISDFPTWGLLRGLCFVNLGQHHKAALSFLYTKSIGRGYAAFPVKLAHKALIEGNYNIPQLVDQLQGQRFVSPKERKSAYDLIQQIDKTSKICGTKERFEAKHIAAASVGLPTNNASNSELNNNFVQLKLVLTSLLEVFSKLKDSSDMDEMIAYVETAKLIKSDIVNQINKLNTTYNLIIFDEILWLNSEKKLAEQLACFDSIPDKINKILTERIEAEKKSLILDMKLAGISTHGDLDKINSLGEIEKLRIQFKNEISQAQIQKKFNQGECVWDDLTVLPPDIKLKLIQQLIENVKNQKSLIDILEYISCDSIEHNTSIRNLVKIIQDKICNIYNRPEPIDNDLFKQCYRMLTPGDFSNMVSMLKIDPHKINIDTLLCLYSLLDEQEHKPELHDIKQLGSAIFDNDKSISDMSELYLKGIHNPALLQRIIDLLIEAKLFSEALYIAIISEDCAGLKNAPGNINTLFFSCLVNYLKANSGKLPLFLQKTDWISSSNDLLNCIVLCLRWDLKSVFNDVVYNNKQLYNEFANTFPNIVLVADHVLGVVPSTYGSLWQEAWEQAKQYHLILEQFRHDLQKKSCYFSWIPAELYQNHFRENLNDLLLDDNKPLFDYDADEVIESATKNGLPAVDPKVVVIMRKFLNTQAARVKTLRDISNNSNGIIPKILIKSRQEVIRELTEMSIRSNAECITYLIDDLKRTISW